MADAVRTQRIVLVDDEPDIVWSLAGRLTRALRNVKVDGLTVGEVGVKRATAVGNVYDLKSLADFDGTYVAGGAGATIGGGAGITAMKNQNGVTIEMKSTTQGASLKLAAEGLKLSVIK